MKTTMDSLEYNWKTPNENAKIFQQEPEQVVGAAPVYFASEEEAIGVEHLLAEPEYDDIVDTLLDFNTCTFSVPKNYFKVFSALESVITKSDHGLNEEDKTNEKLYYPCEQFLDGLSNGYDENHFSISWEDYRLDIELEEESPTVHDVTRDISCIGNVNLENQLADSDRRNCGIHVLKLSDATTSSDPDTVLLDKFDDMSTDQLLEVFRKMFGHQTSVVYKQELEEESLTLHDVTRDISCIGNVNLENQLVDSNGRNCCIHVLKLSDASTSSDHDSVLLDKLDGMSSDKLLKVFKKIFEHQTSVADKEELEEESPTLHDVTRNISCIGNMNLENQLADSNRTNCGIHVLKLSDASTSSDHDSVLLDKLDDISTDKLLEVFSKMFGHQTSVADKQWFWSDKNFSFPKCSLDSENEGAKVPSASCENLLTASTAFASIFNFRRKPRVQRVKRREHIQWNSFKWDSKEFAEENVKCDGTKLGISVQYLKCKPSRGGFGRRYCHRGAKVSSQGLGKRNSQVGRVHIPPGLPIEDRLLGQVDSSSTFSDQSSDNTSEDDWTIGTKTRGTTQYRKHNKYWSTPEVVKLVVGVSKYGVGRWNDIKRMFFQSSVHRSPADLKDKWRNLLRTRSRQLRRGVDAKKKHGVRSIPREVLNHVRELAVIYPYSRQRRARILPTVFVASSSKVEFDNQCFSMNEQDALNFTYFDTKVLRRIIPVKNNRYI